MNSRACAVVGCSNVTDVWSESSRTMNSWPCAGLGRSKFTRMWCEGSSSMNSRACGPQYEPKLQICGQRALGQSIVAHGQSYDVPNLPASGQRSVGL
jgi:hypothetical protein